MKNFALIGAAGFIAPRHMQAIQATIQKHIVKEALNSKGDFQFPLLMRISAKIPFLRNLQARILAYGVRHERISN